MQHITARRRAAASHARRALGALLLAAALAPVTTLAQTATTPAAEPAAYAVTDLNMRKGPGSNDAIIGAVPLGAEVHPVSDAVTNEYTRVTYHGRTGWVVALGLVDTPEEVELATPEEPSDTPLVAFDSDARVTLVPLFLRSEPGLDAEPITGMPEGSLVTLTREGAENGYVTVDYDGAQGWAYADLLAKPGEVS